MVGVPQPEAAVALASFTGLKRRCEVAGTAGDVTVIDDFGHNPAKIATTLGAPHAFPDRLLVMFPPHGHCPLAVLRDALIAGFARDTTVADLLILPDPAYFGGSASHQPGNAT